MAGSIMGETTRRLRALLQRVLTPLPAPPPPAGRPKPRTEETRRILACTCPACGAAFRHSVHPHFASEIFCQGCAADLTVMPDGEVRVQRAEYRTPSGLQPVERR